ncbi:hypothetical protein [Deinococcus humi]|uniref:Putative delta-60 repeat protein n=1 Tax=Deinococcus humi TaxID=662880 RepID=A0A7W8JZI8_9DEIO|nr:hypothetical protein [Deinococcus humi]MBB5365723.1 putative delta-60 repeat protein [Deinococcus humi]GGO38448.1 hypothetical protein GCM10008949_45010 [Deinococcus humi]
MTNMIYSKPGTITNGKLLYITVLFSTLWVQSIAQVQAPSSYLDTTFGKGGLTVTALSKSDNRSKGALAISGDESGDDRGNATYIDPEGLIYVAGQTDNGSDFDFFVARYLPSGVLDTSFGSSGISVTSVGPGDDIAMDIALQQDGKIVVIGYASTVRGYGSRNGTADNVALVRYNKDGTIDKSFGKNGVITTNVGPKEDYGIDVAIQKDGKIIVVGGSNNGNDRDILVTRYDSKGLIDKSFGKQGIVLTAVSSGFDEASAVDVLSNNAIIVAGKSFNGTDTDFTVLKYNNDGTLNKMFGKDGIARFNISNDTADQLVLLKDGKIVIAGFAESSMGSKISVLRLLEDGRLDRSFGFQGIAAPLINNLKSYAYTVGLQSNGKVVVAGEIEDGESRNQMIVRLNSNGRLDTSFGSSGLITSSDFVTCSAKVTADNKIVTVGFGRVGTNNDIKIARYKDSL